MLINEVLIKNWEKRKRGEYERCVSSIVGGFNDLKDFLED